MLLAWFDLGPVYAFLVLAGAALVNLIAEMRYVSQLAGRGLALSAAVVFISFLLGLDSWRNRCLLAVPLTLFVQLICELFEDTVDQYITPTIP
jgi:predicted PurR-regulated permease PerM